MEKIKELRVEHCNQCGKEISIDEFHYGMGECLECFPEF